MAEVIVKISPGGDVRFEVEGVKGNGCLTLTQGLEKSLGQIEHRIEKPEMYLTEAMEVSNGVGH